MSPFRDRRDAGRRLGARLDRFGGEDVVVLGLPRGGVTVAAEVAAILDVPLDVILVRKLGLPFQPEVAMGAIAEGGIRYVDQNLIRAYGVTDRELVDVETAEWRVLEAREVVLRRGRGRMALAGRTVIVVDDGVATGATARAACRAARELGAGHIVLAVPVASGDTLATIVDADEIVCVSTPTVFRAVGEHYEHFGQATDADVVAALDEAASRMSGRRRRE
ncbi:phosphoribosyltransferase [Herbiconiux sp. UC225_62]|uniref:phosphoribosyltransferase n=1 Tax=Herbiconiux sp. UC225_62 TaxID=3350168 RepID=UPI0036D228BA